MNHGLWIVSYESNCMQHTFIQKQIKIWKPFSISDISNSSKLDCKLWAINFRNLLFHRIFQGSTPILISNICIFTDNYFKSYMIFLHIHFKKSCANKRHHKDDSLLTLKSTISPNDIRQMFAQTLRLYTHAVHSQQLTGIRSRLKKSLADRKTRAWTNRTIKK